jgi:ribosomal protein S27AE
MGIDNGFFIKMGFCSLLKSECQVINTERSDLIKMETLTQPELEMKRMVCENCGEGTFEFGEYFIMDKYICSDCSN